MAGESAAGIAGMGERGEVGGGCLAAGVVEQARCRAESRRCPTCSLRSFFIRAPGDHEALDVYRYIAQWQKLPDIAE